MEACWKRYGAIPMPRAIPSGSLSALCAPRLKPLLLLATSLPYASLAIDSFLLRRRIARAKTSVANSRRLHKRELRMSKSRYRPRHARKRPRYRALHSGLEVFGLGMTIGCVILMFGFVILQIMEHFMRR